MWEPRRWLTAMAVLTLLGGTTARAAPPAVTITPVKDGFSFRVGDALVTTYHTSPDLAKPYFWPLAAPDGTPVTRAWPLAPAQPGDATDHVHQKSAWFCHGDVIPEGVELKQKVKGVDGVDFWSETAGHGVIRCVSARVTDTPDGPALVTRNHWLSADGIEILVETRTIHLVVLPQGRLLTVDSELTATVPLTFGDTKEGAFGVRVRESLNAQQSVGQLLLHGGKGRLVNADGKEGEGADNNRARSGCWGLPSDWCDYSGPADGHRVGVAVFADPKNPLPSYWHARGYGLLAANPFGRARSGFPGVPADTPVVKLAKGQTLRLRFGLFTHLGDEKEGKVADAFTEFARTRPERP